MIFHIPVQARQIIREKDEAAAGCVFWLGDNVIEAWDGIEETEDGQRNRALGEHAEGSNSYYSPKSIGGMHQRSISPKTRAMLTGSLKVDEG